MAQVKSEQPEAQAGIKLFGKTIALQVKVESTTIDQGSNSSIRSNTFDPMGPKSPNYDDKGRTSTSHEEAGGLEKSPDKIVACPRCKSMDTKFCYFNNYNVNQPRHFCKGCQRYWTAGGALRNVPVGAGRRKGKPGPPHPPPLPSLFDTGHLDQYLVDGAVFQEYCTHHQRQHLLAAANGGYGGGDFHPDFPAKRRKNGPTGQTNC